MRLNKTLVFAVRFARVSAEYGIPPADLGQMVAAAKASVAAYERGDHAAEQKHGNVVESIAAQHGCKVYWPGLWPCIEPIKRTPGGPGNEHLPAYS